MRLAVNVLSNHDEGPSLLVLHDGSYSPIALVLPRARGEVLFAYHFPDPNLRHRKLALNISSCTNKVGQQGRTYSSPW